MRTDTIAPVDLSRHEAKALRAITLLSQATRKNIADCAKLSMGVVSSTLAALLDRGYVTRASETPGKGGRPAHLYRVSGSIGRVVGVSLDPDRVRLISMDAAGNQGTAREVPLVLSQDPARHTAEIVECIASGVADLAEGAASPLLHVGVTLPGVTDADQGMWVQGFQVSGIRHVSFRDILATRLQVPVLIEDPARAAAFRELRQGRGVGARSFVLLYLDYGVGSGVVLGSDLYRGRDGLSGEVGHLVVDPNGYRCSCGDVGCLETVASTTGILRCVRERLAQGVVSSLLPAFQRNPQGVTLQDVLGAADSGDRLAQSTLHEIGERIGSACATVIKIVNPERLIVGGTGAMFARYFEPRVRMMLDKHVIPEMLAGLSLHFCEHSPDDEAHGAALMALELYWSRRVAELDGGSAVGPLPSAPEGTVS